MSLSVLVILAVVATFAYLIKGAIGFGPSLIIVALLSHALGGKAAVIIAGVLGVIGNLFLLWWTRDEQAAPNWWLVALLMGVGSWVGTELMRVLDPDLFQWMIGIGLAIYSARQLISSDAAAGLQQSRTPIAGPFGAGVADGLMSTGGTLLVASLAPQLTPSALRRTLPLVLLAPALVRSATYAYHGMMAADVVVAILVITPFVIVGEWVGFKVSARVEPLVLQKAIWALVLTSSIALLFF